MAVSPKIVHTCDHVISNSNKMYGGIVMIKGPNYMPDKVPSNISVIRIDSVTNCDGSIEYTKGIDYIQKVSSDIIEWIKGPKPGDKYLITAAYMKTSIEKYNPEECSRCGGNGWYSDIFRNMSVVIDGDKLAQDIIKILFTEKVDGYGSNIKDALAQNVYNEVELGLSVSSSIEDCAEQIKKMQQQGINGGATISPDEALDSITVKDILFIRSENTCYVKIEIKSMSGKSIDFSFMV